MWPRCLTPAFAALTPFPEAAQRAPNAASQTDKTSH